VVITDEGSDGVAVTNDMTGIGVNGAVEVHVYGSVIRAIAPLQMPSNSKVVGVNVSNGEAHIHGTGIDVLSTAGNQIIALRASTTGMIHANASSYNLSTGPGDTVARVSDPGHRVHAPYLWETHDTPPSITSVTGYDMAVVAPVGGSPRLVIYDSNCASKWFDTVTQACRP